MSPHAPKLPQVTASELLRALKRASWYEVRQSGSHLRLRHDERPEDLTISMYGAAIPTGTLRAILEQAGLSPTQFLELL